MPFALSGSLNQSLITLTTIKENICEKLVKSHMPSSHGDHWRCEWSESLKAHTIQLLQGDLPKYLPTSELAT
jgi:hypothetical protein